MITFKVEITEYLENKCKNAKIESDMNLGAKHKPYWDNEKLFQLFKYTIYVLILGHVVYFMIEDYAASSHTYKDGISFTNIGDAFSASVDSIAWFVLLMIFELETYALEDDQLSKKRKLMLNVIAAVCYGFIIWAFLGYIEKSTMVYAFQATSITDLCAIANSELSLVLDLDDYVPLTLENCGSVSGQLYYHTKTMMYVDQTVYDEVSKLVLIDVVNAFTWIVVVVVLQIEVFLQLRGHLSSYMYKVNSFIKGVAYLILLLACLYWGYMGDRVGFQDALLWLLAFIFIELNIFQWRREEDTDKEVVL